MKKLTEFIIPFSGMKIGDYDYSFKVGKEFFEAFEYSEIKEGSVEVLVTLNKSETMMLFNFELNGVLNLECDKCLGEVDFEISNQTFRQIFKFTDEEDLQLDDEICFVPSSQFEVNLAPFILEFVNLCKPNKVLHTEGECDPGLTSVLEEYLLVEKDEDAERELEEENIDPRWNVLKKLKK